MTDHQNRPPAADQAHCLAPAPVEVAQSRSIYDCFETIAEAIEAAPTHDQALGSMAAALLEFVRLLQRTIYAAPPVSGFPTAARLADALAVAVPVFGDRLICLANELEELTAAAVALARLCIQPLHVIQAYHEMDALDDWRDLLMILVCVVDMAERCQRLRSRTEHRARNPALVAAARAEPTAGSPLQ